MLKYTNLEAREVLKEKDNFYNYDKFEYKGALEKSIITCNIHGDFSINFNNKINGQGCPKCGKIKNIKPKEKRYQEFLNKVSKIPNLNFSKFNFINHSTKSTVVCSLHGDFLQYPKHLIKGTGCPKCGRIKQANSLKKPLKVKVKKPRISQIISYEERIKQLNIIHKNKYTYLFYKNVKSRDKIEISCPIHGKFYQRLGDHLQGKGCRKCSQCLSNFSKTQWIKKGKGKEGIFYILECSNENELFYKIGITFTSIKHRYPSKQSMPYDFKIMKEIKSYDLAYIWELESKLKQNLAPYNYKPLNNFPGDYSECFKDCNIGNNWYEAK